MKKFKFVLRLGMFCSCSIFACKKTSLNTTSLASLYMINGVVNLGTVKANFTNAGSKTGVEFYSAISTSIAYGANYGYSILANQNVPLTVAPIADTLAPILTTNLNFSTGNIYSLFLAGQTGAVDTVWVRESFPAYADSSCGIRFINLSYNSNPVIVTQTATPTTIDFNSLAYKQYSQFKTYTAKSVNSSYSFQVRDAGTNVILASYVLTTPHFHNVTLGFIGQIGGVGANAPKVVRVNNY